jgi:hypothetical protein
MLYYFTYSTVDQCTVDTDYAEVATPYIVYVSLGSVGPYILSTELILLEQYSIRYLKNLLFYAGFNKMQT